MIFICFIVSHNELKVNLFFVSVQSSMHVFLIKKQLVVDFFEGILYNDVKGSIFMEISFVYERK